MWSGAPNPAVTVTVRLSGDLVKGLGLEQVGAIDSHDPDPGFEDVLIPRFGAEYKIGSRFAVRGGYFFRPTFVPRQDGATNLLDGSTHTLSGGIGVNFPDPLEILAEPVQVDLAAQHGFIMERTATKPTASGTPSYTYSGGTSLFTASIRYNF
jgi:long-subunit fatty acid transport protein